MRRPRCQAIDNSSERWGIPPKPCTDPATERHWTSNGWVYHCQRHAPQSDLYTGSFARKKGGGVAGW